MEYVYLVLPYLRAALGFLAVGWLIMHLFVITALVGSLIAGRVNKINMNWSPFLIAAALMVAHWGLPPWK